jgi:murein DD-endopeptidase MepM/ murein hydrolase activator NlpD
MSSKTRARRWTATVAISLALAGLAAPAHAETAVQRVLSQRHEVVHSTQALRRKLGAQEDVLRAQIAHARLLLTRGPGIGRLVHPERWRLIRGEALDALRHAPKQLHRLARAERRGLASLHARYAQATAWLDTYGVFRTCPVPGYTSIANNFGIMVRLPHVPVHRHEGNDIGAPAYAPIVAPFDGYAAASWSTLGGLIVKVTGARGYVFNAHLASVGRLGEVHTGDVIGYVGTTGDATGPHDHIEWHPWGGAAVDPNPYLVAACVPLAP